MALPLDWVEDPIQQRNNDRIGLELRLPVPQVRVYHDTTQSITNSTATALTFNSERYDNGGLHSTSSNPSRLTAPITGLYVIGANIEWSSTSTAGYRYMKLRVNGSSYIGTDQDDASDAIEHTNHLEVQWRLAAGDYVEVVVGQNSGGALNVLSSAAYSPEFWMSRLAGYTAQTVEA